MFTTLQVRAAIRKAAKLHNVKLHKTSWTERADKYSDYNDTRYIGFAIDAMFEERIAQQQLVISTANKLLGKDDNGQWAVRGDKHGYYIRATAELA